MKIKLITVSREEDQNAKAIFQKYLRRLQHYISFEALNLKPARDNTPEKQKQSDAKQILMKISAGEQLVLLDETGKEFNSLQFADLIQQKMNSGISSLCFIVGGAYGFDKSIYERCDMKIALSRLTFPHQLAKIVFIEQIYRAFTILHNEKYHH